MDRRELLAWAGTAGAIAVAGCIADAPTEGNVGSDDGGGSDADDPDESAADGGAEDGGNGDGTGEGDGGDEESSSDDTPGPAATVEAFFEAFDAGDASAINAYLHEDGELPEITEEEAEELTETAYEASEIETVDEDGETASVELLLTMRNEEGEHGPIPQRAELRLDDGEWKIWSIRGDTSERIPSVSFDTEYREDELVIVHQAGDSVPADRLFIGGSGLESTGRWDELDGTAGDDGTVTAGDRLTVGVGEEYELTIVWEDPENGTSATLHSEAGAVGRETASEAYEAPPAVRDHLEDVDNFSGTVANGTGEDDVRVQVGPVADVEQEFVFGPAAIQIEPGTSVIWEWIGDDDHSVTATDGSFDSGVVAGEGETWSYTFEEPGIYLYRCVVHGDDGQRGAVVVEGDG